MHTQYLPFVRRLSGIRHFDGGIISGRWYQWSLDFSKATLHGAVERKDDRRQTGGFDV